jgi:hypothetical protein
MSGLPAAVSALVTPSPTPSVTPTDTSGSLVSGNIGPGWVAAVIVLLVILATVLLMVSMRHQMKKVTFDEGPAPENEPPVWPTRPAPRRPGPGDSVSPRRR